ncbi:hypothetical protein DENSPDRAFT_842031 [Dentipellis sp. KUC8613]|nr:hypothetical protein DENSPDRAFT_842031 [Dentipellis sp. KUC8613]
MSDNDYGRLGVLRLMKRQDPEAVVASYPIDDEEVTFGRDQSCNVRLYYPSVSPLHAKIIFQERKAFLVVLGTHGVHVDNCPVHPAPPAATAPTTIPLPNNTHIEIHKKSFKFEYPPKALRAALLATPSPQKASAAAGTPRRALRMSMIQSAQVFSPAPSRDPRENLRVLQSPIKPLTSPLKKGYRAPSPDEEDVEEDEEEEIVLVDGDCPRVVQEEKDLVILEDVEVIEPPPMAAPVHATPVRGGTQPLSIQKRNGQAVPRTPVRTGGWVGRLQSTPQPQPQPAPVQQYQTPRRPPRPSLHRAVLIRSAQRAVMRVEMEQEEEEDEKEVEMSVVAAEDIIEEDDEPDEDQGQEVSDDDDDAEGNDEGGKGGEQEERSRPLWRKSLEAVRNGWERIRSRSRSPEKGEQVLRQDEQEEDITEAQPPHDSDEEEDDHNSADEDGNDADDLYEYDENASSADAALHPEIPHFTPQHAQQPARVVRTGPAPVFMTPQPLRPSSGKADRVRGLGRLSHGGFGAGGPGPSWKVRDIIVPLKGGDEDEVKQEATDEWMPEMGERRRVSAEEKKAIQERRRSAYMAPDPFFGNQIPGARRSDSPAPTPVLPPPSAPRSPVKDRLREEDDEKEETSVLLERMREMVAGLQRRRSGKMEDEAKETLRKQLIEEQEEKGEAAGEVEEEAENDEEGDEDSREYSAMDVDKPEIAPSQEFPAPLQYDQPPPQTPHMLDLKHVFSTAQLAARTPRMDGVRELFHAPAQEAAHTPKFDGVREMYLREQPRDVPSPVYEGVEEMMATPAGYRVSELAQEELADVESMEEEDGTASGRSTPDEPPPALTRSTRGRRTPTATTAPADKATTRRRMPTDGSTMGDDEATPDVGAPPPRAGRKAAVPSEKPKGAIVRRTRKETEEPAPAPAKTATRARKADTAIATRIAAKATTSTAASRVRATRKPVDSAPSTDDEPAAKLPARKARGAKTPGASEESTTTRTPATRRGAKAKNSAPAVSDDDPMDSIDEPEDAPAPPATTARRTAKSKAVEDDATTDTTLRTTRGRKTPTPAAPPAAATRSATTAKGRTAASVKKVASTDVKVKKEKENTPEVSAREEEEKPAPAAKTTVRAKRGTVASKAKAQSEPEKEVAEVKTRAPRTRAASARK